MPEELGPDGPPSGSGTAVTPVTGDGLIMALFRSVDSHRSPGWRWCSLKPVAVMALDELESTMRLPGTLRRGAAGDGHRPARAAVEDEN